MNEAEKQKEYLRFRRLNILAKIGWILSLRWLHPAWWWRRKPVDFTDEPPMISLARVAEGGFVEPVRKIRFNHKTIEQAMALFAMVSLRDGDVAGDETALVAQFIRDNGPEEISDDEVEECLKLFASAQGDHVSFKNAVFALNKGLDRVQKGNFIKGLYRVAFLHGLETKETHNVVDIGKRLGLSFTDIRQFAQVVRKEISQRNDVEPEINNVTAETGESDLPKPLISE